MNNKLIIRALLIVAIGVYIVDYFSHLYWSTPMETSSYFLVKAIFFFVFSLFFLRKEFIIKKFNTRFKNVLFGGVVISALYGVYYNILPLYGYNPLGISLYGLSFLGMGLLGTGIAFGTIHTLAFVIGFYLSKPLSEMIV